MAEPVTANAGASQRGLTPPLPRPRALPILRLMGPPTHVATWLICAALAWSADAAAADAAAEALARRVAATPGAGEVLWLDGAGEETLALYSAERATPALGAVLLLHGLGRNADWPGPIASLRRRLPDAGWQTLSVQLPAPDVAAPPEVQTEIVDAALERIGAGYRFLLERGASVVAIVGHRWGVGPAALFLGDGARENVSALVAIAPTHPAPGPDPMQVAAIVGALDLPVLEIVIAGRQAPPRAARPPEAPARDRIEIVSAEPGLGDAGDAVFKRLRPWLARHAVAPEEEP